MWKLDRNRKLKQHFGNLKEGTVVSVEHDWVPTFALLPHKTITGKYIWLRKIYMRRVWIYTGFIDEPETQYGDIFEILAHGEVRN